MQFALLPHLLHLKVFMIKKKHDFHALVTSKFFVDSRYSKDDPVSISIISDNEFWNDCLIVVNIMAPFMLRLRIVDCDERPLIGYVYKGMYRPPMDIKKTIQALSKYYKAILESTTA